MLLGKAAEAEKKHNGSRGLDLMEANLLFQEIMLLLLRALLHEQPSNLHAALRFAQAYMERNYPSEITRRKLAEITGLHPDSFSRAFKRQFRKSPNAYLNDLPDQASSRAFFSVDCFLPFFVLLSLCDKILFLCNIKGGIQWLTEKRSISTRIPKGFAWYSAARRSRTARAC
jgi:AraC-like DNA-binding protein